MEKQAQPEQEIVPAVLVFYSRAFHELRPLDNLPATG